MADEGANTKEVFRRSAMSRVASADELDHYIKVTNPNAWIVVLAALLLVGGVLIWALVAIVPVTVETTGVTVQPKNSDDTTVVCFVSKATAKRIQETGMKVSIEGVEAQSATIDNTPMSASEVVSFFGSDFYVNSIDLDDWNYPIVIEPGAHLNTSNYSIGTQLGEAHLVPVRIITSETQPINIVLGKK